MTDTEAMELAIAACREGIEAGQAPFGAAIVRAGRIVVAEHNTTQRDTDPTAHAEVNALRQAARLLNTTDLSGCTLYSTCEPCPMCLAAAFWSHIERVVFGASINDARAAGFSQITLSAAELAARGTRLVVEGGLRRADCVELFRDWARRQA